MNFKLVVIHTIKPMASYLVLEDEIKIITKKIEMLKAEKKNTDELDIKLDSLNSVIQFMQSRCESGLINPKIYKQEMNDYLDYQKKLYQHLRSNFDDKSEMMMRIVKRIELTMKEIDITPDSQGGQDQPMPPPKEEKKMISNPPAKSESNQITVISTQQVVQDIFKEDVKEVRNSQMIINEEKLNSIVEYNPQEQSGVIRESVFVSEKKVDYSKVSKEQLDEIDNLIMDFESAIKYIQEEGSSQNEGKLREKRVALGRYKQHILEGKTIDFYEMNIYLSPSDIIGMGESERLTKFKEVISLLSNQVKLYIDRANYLIEEIKKNVI